MLYNLNTNETTKDNIITQSIKNKSYINVLIISVLLLHVIKSER